MYRYGFSNTAVHQGPCIHPNPLDKSDTRSTELVLISCLMCIHYELLQENYPVAQTHLEKALKVMKPLSHNPKNWPASKALCRAVNLITIDEDLIQVFARLDVQASTYLARRAPRLSTVIALTDMPGRFTRLRQA